MSNRKRRDNRGSNNPQSETESPCWHRYRNMTVDGFLSRIENTSDREELEAMRAQRSDQEFQTRKAQFQRTQRLKIVAKSAGITAAMILVLLLGWGMDKVVRNFEIGFVSSSMASELETVRNWIVTDDGAEETEFSDDAPSIIDQISDLGFQLSSREKELAQVREHAQSRESELLAQIDQLESSCPVPTNNISVQSEPNTRVRVNDFQDWGRGAHQGMLPPR